MKTFAVFCQTMSRQHLPIAIELANLRHREGHKVVFILKHRTSGHHERFDEFYNFPRTWKWRRAELEASLLKVLPADVAIVRPAATREEIALAGEVASEILRSEDIDQLMKQEWSDLDIGLGVASSLVTSLCETRPHLNSHQEKVNAAVCAFVLTYLSTCRTLEEHHVSDAYIFNGRFVEERAALRACQSLGVNHETYECAGDFAKYVIYGTVPHDRIGVQRSMQELGHQVRDTHRERFRKVADRFFEKRRAGNFGYQGEFAKLWRAGQLPSIPAGDRLFTFFSSSEDEILAIGDAFGQEGFPTQFKAVKALVSEVERVRGVTLAIRVHPHLIKKSKADREQWSNLRLPENVVLIPPESPIDSYSLIDNSVAVLTYGSTTGLEAAYSGKPSFLLGSSFYDQLGCTHQCFSEEAVRRCLCRPELIPGQVDAARLFGYYHETVGNQYEFFTPTRYREGNFGGFDLFEYSRVLKTSERLVGIIEQKLVRGRQLLRRFCGRGVR